MKKIPVTAEAAKSFDDKVKALEKAAADAKASGKSTPVQATFTEAELTSAVNQATASGSGATARSIAWWWLKMATIPTSARLGSWTRFKGKTYSLP